MPINAYTGLMGSGKSYEVVATPILRALRMGRRVVTNVDGIDSDKCREFLVEFHKADFDDLGEVIHCTNDQVFEPHFFPHGTDDETFCQPGDLVCIDEAWRFWGTSDRISPEHKIFFAEHRHYVHPETKVPCDLVLMVQDIGMLNRGLKFLVEMTFRTHKIKSLGLNKIYRLEMYEGYKLNKSFKVSVENKKYDKRIFELYSSYVGGQGDEKQIDDRQNILRRPKTWIFVFGVIALLIWSIKNFIAFFNPETHLKKKPEVASSSVSSTSSSAQPADSSKPALNTQAPVPVVPKVQWRLVGAYDDGNGKSFVMFRSSRGETRIEEGAPPSAFDGLRAKAYLDGELVRSTTVFDSEMSSGSPSVHFGSQPK